MTEPTETAIRKTHIIAEEKTDPTKMTVDDWEFTVQDIVKHVRMGKKMKYNVRWYGYEQGAAIIKLQHHITQHLIAK